MARPSLCGRRAILYQEAFHEQVVDNSYPRRQRASRNGSADRRRDGMVRNGG